MLFMIRRVELAAFAGFKIDIDDEQSAIVLAHRGKKGRFAIGAATGMEAHPVDGFDWDADFSNSDLRGRG